MIILTLNSSGPELQLGLFKHRHKVAYLKLETGNQLSEVLYREIVSFLNKNSLTINDLNGINCFRGPGSFTGLRIAISLVNALAYSLHIKVVGSLGENWIREGG